MASTVEKMMDVQQFRVLQGFLKSCFCLPAGFSVDQKTFEI